MLNQQQASTADANKAIALPDQTNAKQDKPELDADWLKRADHLGSQIASLFK